MIYGGSTLEIDNTNNLSIQNKISGQGNLIDNGSGTLSLLGTETFSGLTTINTGKLVVNGTHAAPSTYALLGLGVLAVILAYYCRKIA